MDRSALIATSSPVLISGSLQSPCSLSDSLIDGRSMLTVQKRSSVSKKKDGEGEKCASRCESVSFIVKGAERGERACKSRRAEANRCSFFRGTRAIRANRERVGSPVP